MKIKTIESVYELAKALKYNEFIQGLKSELTGRPITEVIDVEIISVVKEDLDKIVIEAYNKAISDISSKIKEDPIIEDELKIVLMGWLEFFKQKIK